MGFVHKIKLNLKLPYLQVDAAKPQGLCLGRTLRGGLGPVSSVDLCLQSCQGTFHTGNSSTADGPPCRADFDIYDNNVMAVNEFQLLNVT